MKFSFNKEQSRSIIYSLIISLLLFIIPIISSILGYRIIDAFIALSISELGIAAIWLFIRMGLFSTSSYGSRKALKMSFEKKNKKFGTFDDQKKSKFNIAEYNSPMDLEENSSAKSKAGIYTMFILGSIELLISIIIVYS
ncbi:MAG: DUF3899 domain-containing protein [Mycoplasmatales bacterium]|nr:DUF3899 domain-containing protein [Mycoplasmatales bacterium]